jgi:hypothetical protein
MHALERRSKPITNFLLIRKGANDPGKEGIAEGTAPESWEGSILPDNNNRVFVVVFNSFCIQLMLY